MQNIISYKEQSLILFKRIFNIADSRAFDNIQLLKKNGKVEIA